MTAPADDAILAIGREIHAALPKASRHPLRALDAKAMDLATADGELRAALFRFVDVVPACRSVDDLVDHLSGFLEEVDDAPPPLQAAMRASHTAVGRQALGRAAAAGVRHMAHRFIVGASVPDARGTLTHLWRHDGIATSVDLLGEATVTPDEAQRYARRCADALDELAAVYAALPAKPVLEHDHVGPLPRANLSVKVSALTPLLRPDAPERGKRDAAPRLRELLRHAKRTGAHLHIDMESYDSREAILDLVLELLAEPEFADGPSAGIVLQAYLRDAPDTLGTIDAWTRATSRSTPLVVRLVKGAYWDHEVVIARQHGWDAPVWEEKAESDRAFEALTRTLLAMRPRVRVAIASHNLRSVAHAIAANRATGHDDGDVELQILRGLGDDLGHALATRDFRVRAYCPVGDLVSGMAYLVRRLLENTANDSFLAAEHAGTAIEDLMRAP